jgi:hypothetical protein
MSFSFSLSAGNQLKLFRSVLSALGKIGNDLLIEALQDKVRERERPPHPPGPAAAASASSSSSSLPAAP